MESNKFWLAHEFNILIHRKFSLEIKKQFQFVSSICIWEKVSYAMYSQFVIFTQSIWITYKNVTRFRNDFLNTKNIVYFCFLDVKFLFATWYG